MGLVLTGATQTDGASGASNAERAGTWVFANCTKSTKIANQKRNLLAQEATQPMPGWAKWGSEGIKSPSLAFSS